MIVSLTMDSFVQKLIQDRQELLPTSEHVYDGDYCDSEDEYDSETPPPTPCNSEEFVVVSDNARVFAEAVPKATFHHPQINSHHRRRHRHREDRWGTANGQTKNKQKEDRRLWSGTRRRKNNERRRSSRTSDRRWGAIGRKINRSSQDRWGAKTDSSLTMPERKHSEHSRKILSSSEHSSETHLMSSLSESLHSLTESLAELDVSERSSRSRPKILQDALESDREDYTSSECDESEHNSPRHCNKRWE